MTSSSLGKLDGVVGRLLGGLLAIVLGLLAVFLFTAFAVLAAILAVAVVARAWWRGRVGGSGGDDGRTIDAEYSVSREDVEPDTARKPDAILPPRRPRP